LWYILKADRETVFDYDKSEFKSIRWFKADEIPYDRSDPHMKRFIDKISNKLITLSSYDQTIDQYSLNTASLHPTEDGIKFIRDLPADGKILDIGCGPGRDAKVFVQEGFDVTGVDFSPEMVRSATAAVPKGSFYLMDIEQLDFPPNTFHGAWANCSLMHLPKKNLPYVLEKIYSILKHDGQFYLTAKEGHSSAEVLESDLRYDGAEKFWSYYSAEELKQIVIEAGFIVTDVLLKGKRSDYQTHPIIRIFARKP
jgi:SAM-dependent methyltransferase